MSDPIEEALRHGCTGVMHHPPDRRCVEALEALAVLRGRIAEAEDKVAWNAEHISEVVTLERERRKAAEASVVSLREVLARAARRLEEHGEWEAAETARAALASSEEREFACLDGEGGVCGECPDCASSEAPGETP